MNNFVWVAGKNSDCFLSILARKNLIGRPRFQPVTMLVLFATTDLSRMKKTIWLSATITTFKPDLGALGLSASLGGSLADYRSCSTRY